MQAEGQPLIFDRRKGGVDLTEAGATAYQVAERVFHDIDQLQSSLLESERQIKGMISIGTVNSIGIYELPGFLPEFRKSV